MHTFLQGYDISFLITNEHMDSMWKHKVIDFLIQFMEDVDAQVRKHTRNTTDTFEPLQLCSERFHHYFVLISHAVVRYIVLDVFSMYVGVRIQDFN